jgi:hypothetical protein
METTLENRKIFYRIKSKEKTRFNCLGASDQSHAPSNHFNRAPAEGLGGKVHQTLSLMHRTSILAKELLSRKL